MRNRRFDRVGRDYLFQEVARRRDEFLKQNRDAELIDFGIGDTTLPLSPVIVEGMIAQAKRLSRVETYTGYESSQGRLELREKICEVFYPTSISPMDISVTDGAKCDFGRLLYLFDQSLKIGVQGPSYPVYVDTLMITGLGRDGIVSLPCHPDNGFFPHVEALEGLDLLILCNPNNPTGEALSREQLETIIAFARKHRLLIIYDAAYSCYIQDSKIPKTVYEIEGSEEVCIEINSFSKSAGFTGVRLGWTVVPKQLEKGLGYDIQRDWNRTLSTFFNGASSLAQAGGLAALSLEGRKEIRRYCHASLANATSLRRAIEEIGFSVYGGKNAPYLWIDLCGKDSWEAFDTFLSEYQIVTTPGVGFGLGGEGFLRLSCFASKRAVHLATQRLKKQLLPLDTKS